MAMGRFPQAIQDFGNAFVSLQDKRHRADYAPDERHFKHAVLRDIVLAEAVIRGFQRTALAERRAFAAHVLVRPRK